MQDVHSGGARDQFDMQLVKPIIDESDDLLAEIYGLSDEEVESVPKDEIQEPKNDQQEQEEQEEQIEEEDEEEEDDSSEEDAAEGLGNMF